MGKIFVSYSRNDGEFIDCLIDALQGLGYEFWIDRHDIGAGSAWRAEISKAIRECQAFLLVLSPQSTDSENVTRELSIADSHRRHIIPILYQDAQIPASMEYQLADLQTIRFSEEDFAGALERLDWALSHLPAKQAVSSSPAKQPFDPGIKVKIPETNPVRPATSGMRPTLAIAAFVIGVINLCAWAFPICGIPLAVVGVAAGLAGMGSSRKWLAVAGVILSLFGLLAGCTNAFYGGIIGSQSF